MLLNSSETFLYLIGIGKYQDSELHDLPAAFDNIAELRRLFNNEILGLGNTNIQVKSDIYDKQCLIEIRNILKKPEIKNFIFYYAGHGVLDENENNKLYLTLSNSSIENIDLTGISIDELNKVFSCYQKNILFIFDCCFSERAFEQIQQRNFIAISSSSINHTSKYPQNEIFSAFTNELISVLREGLENENKEINFLEIFNQLKNNLIKKEYPEPKFTSANLISEFCIINNYYSENNNLSLINLKTIQKINSIISNTVNQILLSSSVVDTIAPKNIKDIFVIPLLSQKPAEKNEVGSINSSDDIKLHKEFVNIENIIKSNKNYIIFGSKETGKTTLLNYLSTILIEQSIGYFNKIPIYFKFTDINPKDKRSIMKLIASYFFGSNINFETLLKEGNCIVLIDDFDFKESNKINILKSFFINYKKNSFIITTDLDLFNSLEIPNTIELGITYEKIYLNYFTSKRTKQLVSNWFMNTNKNIEEIFSIISDVLSFANLPRTPLNICFLLWILEKQDDFSKIINKASLIEKFVDIILEKLIDDNTSIQKIDFRTKEHYLSFIAGKMSENELYFFEYGNLAQITQEYFKNKGHLYIPISDFLEYLVRKGIFSKRDNIISFKFKCICEFFIAKQMIEEKKFYDKILIEDYYLKYLNEIDYLTGLQRNNYDILFLLNNRLNTKLDLFEQTQCKLEFQSFENMNTNVFETESVDDFSDLINESTVLSNEPEPEIIDEEIELLIPTPSQLINRNEKQLFDYDFNVEIIVLSKVLKNCELVDRDLKSPIVHSCIKAWSKLLILLFKTSNDFINEGKLDELFNEFAIEEIDLTKDKFKELFNIFIPEVILRLIYEHLGTDKLQSILKEEIINSPESSLVEKFISVFLYSDLKLSSYIGIIRKFYEEKNNTKYIYELIYRKLLGYYFQRSLQDKAMREQFENLIWDVTASLESWDKKHADKTLFIQKLRQKKLIISKIKEDE